MELKRDLCKAFCDGVEVSTFDGGIAVSTPYCDRSGDKISLYALGPVGGPYRLVDNALTVSMLEADGFNLETQGRRTALFGLLSEYGASYEEEFGEIYIDDVKEKDLAKTVLNFSALLLRMSDLLFLNQDRVESTFKDDIKSILKDRFQGKVNFTEDEPVSNQLQEISPDMVFFPEGRPPVAFFVASSEARLWQAMHLRLIADYERHFALSVVAMLQTDSSVGAKARTQADNRLDAIPRYQNDPTGAVQRVITEVLGREHTVH